jgi:hypothetical protein
MGAFLVSADSEGVGGDWERRGTGDREKQIPSDKVGTFGHCVRDEIQEAES